MIARGDVARQTSVALAVSRKGDEVRLGVRSGRHGDGRSWPSRPRDDGGGNNSGVITDGTHAGRMCVARWPGVVKVVRRGSSRAPLVGKRREVVLASDKPRVGDGQHCQSKCETSVRQSV
jgi:hypothetical protein